MQTYHRGSSNAALTPCRSCGTVVHKHFTELGLGKRSAVMQSSLGERRCHCTTGDNSDGGALRPGSGREFAAEQGDTLLRYGSCSGWIWPSLFWIAILW